MLQPQKQLTFLDFMNVLHPVVCLSDFIHKITVQASPGLEKRRNSPDLGSGSSPSFGPRFRAIQRECSRFYVHIYMCMWRCFSTRWEKQKNNVSHHLACTHRLCCDITRLHFQIYSFYVLSTTHSSFCLPISLWAPAPFLSLPLTALSLSHTPFSLFNSVFQSKYYLTSFQQLSTSQQLFIFPPLPCSAPLLCSPADCSYIGAAVGGAIQPCFPGT